MFQWVTTTTVQYAESEWLLETWNSDCAHFNMASQKFINELSSLATK